MQGALLAALVAVSQVGPALAQPELGSRIDPARGAVGTLESTDERTARRVMSTFGRCVARNRSRLAEEVLALPVFSEEQYALARRRVGGEDGCLGVGDRELRFSPMLLVGAMAEWFILERYENADLGAVAALTDDRLQEAGLTPRSGYEDVALCLVRRDPVAARDVVRSRPATGAERAAIARLVPHRPVRAGGPGLSLQPRLRPLAGRGRALPDLVGDERVVSRRHRGNSLTLRR